MDHAAASGCPVAHGADRASRTSVCGYAGGAKRGYFIPGMIALAVLLVGGGIVDAAAFSHGSPHRLPGPLISAQIADNYQGNHGLASPPPVRCPGDEPVTAGHHFTCQLLRANAAPLAVSVTETGGGQVSYQVAGSWIDAERR